ncbi:MAG: hypothetical protein WCA12_14500 [Burkholderiales bacterium]
MRMAKAVWVPGLLAAAVSAGCITATNSGVVPAANGELFIAVRTPGDKGGWEESLRVARQEATQFCAKEGKKPKVTNQEAGPYEVDLTFRCEP